MKRSIIYNTKQRELVLNYIISLGGAHVTAAQIMEHCLEEDISIGRTTVYRHLDKLTDNGELRKYTVDGVSSACYQYTGCDTRVNCYDHLHLKCEDCGELFHFEYSGLNGLQDHILDKYSFRINALKTVLYGKCGNCAQKS